MADRVDRTLTWAQGLGRQSGLLALNAATIAGIPFLYGIRPCTDASCTVLWDRLFFVPNLLFIPAIAATFWLWGSWRAQRGNARYERKWFAQLEAREIPDIPPGHVQPPELERDLARRTLRHTALGALLAAVALGLLGNWNGIGLRRCDPMTFSWHTGLQRCSTAREWVDAIVAFQVWGLLAVSLLAAVLLARRARKYREPRAEATPRKLGASA